MLEAEVDRIENKNIGQKLVANIGLVDVYSIS